ncbi:unnamed protein product [Triticum turgidum subsp. durum]|uniref:CRAL-TRIO domain-containing protein n=1 Tax=Triticum turgidum subsp. durum TaxID=4567 RepID=A0A9R1S9G6_TRITD|nr:unnamed protein product [Triticum turgidum subsp. durum]
MALASGSGSGGGSDFSVMVIGSDFAVDAGAALLASPADREEWHDCAPDLGDDFSDLEELQVVRVQGADRSGRPVVRVVGKFFPAPVIDGGRLKRGIYEELPAEYKERLQIFYFLHPGLYSWLAMATLGRLFLSGGLYWKIKYVSRLEYLWGDIKKGEVEIPDFVTEHDKILEHRPLTDYGIEPDPLHLADIPAAGYSLGRYEDKWSPEDRWHSRNYM